jgi:hypothetical protein
MKALSLGLVKGFIEAGSSSRWDKPKTTKLAVAAALLSMQHKE